MDSSFLQQVRDTMERAYRGENSHTAHIQAIPADDVPASESAALRSTLAALHASYAMVGQLPPEPPTFRGRMGARLVRLVKRMLFWYTPQIVYFQYSALRALEEQTKQLEAAEKRICKLESELARLHAASGDAGSAG